MKTNPNEPISHMTGEQDQWCKFAGLTKREYFAAMALQGMSANSLFHSYSFTEVAKFAVYQADALIEELNKPAEDGKVEE